MDPKRVAVGIFQLEPAAHRRADGNDVSIHANHLVVDDLRIIEELGNGEGFISVDCYIVSEAGPLNGNAVISDLCRRFREEFEAKCKPNVFPGANLQASPALVAA